MSRDRASVQDRSCCMCMGSAICILYILWRLNLELLSKPKPRVYELDGAWVCKFGVAPLDAGVLAEMVDTAESILRDYRQGFERVDDEGGAKGAGIGCIVGELGGVCHCSAAPRRIQPVRYPMRHCAGSQAR